MIHDVYDALRPRWRGDALVPEKKITPEENARIMAQIKPMMDALNLAHKGQP